MNSPQKPIDNRLKPKWLPQVQAPKDYVLNELSREGVVYKEEVVDPATLKPSQAQVDKNKAQAFMEMIDRDEEIDSPYVSADNNIMDGHHRAYAFTKHPDVEKCSILKIYLPNEDAARILNKIQDRFDFEQEYAQGGRSPLVPFAGAGEPEQLGGFNAQAMVNQTQAAPMQAPQFDANAISQVQAPQQMQAPQTASIESTPETTGEPVAAIPSVTPDHIAGIRQRMTQLAGTKAGEELGATEAPAPIQAPPAELPLPVPQDTSDDDIKLKEMEVVSSENDGQPVQAPSGEQMEDEPLPVNSTEVETDVEPEIVAYDSATKNEQDRTCYKTKPINTMAKTGDFLLLTQKDGFKFKYELRFENLLEIPSKEVEAVQYPTEAPLLQWMEGATPESLQAKAKEAGLTYELYLSRTVNQQAKRRGFDGVQYGDKFVQIINDVN